MIGIDWPVVGMLPSNVTCWPLGSPVTVPLNMTT